MTSTIIEHYRESGFISLIQKVFRKFVYRRQVFALVKYDLHSPPRRFRSSKRWYTRQLTAADLGRFKRYFSDHYQDYVDLFNNGYVCFGAIESEEDAVISIAFYASKDFYDQHYHHYTFKVAPHQIFQFAGEVAEPFRNTQVSVNVMYTAYEYWIEQGKDEVFCTIEENNAASMRVVFHLGWDEVGELINFHRTLGFNWQTVERYKGKRFTHYHKKKKSIES